MIGDQNDMMSITQETDQNAQSYANRAYMTCDTIAQL